VHSPHGYGFALDWGNAAYVIYHNASIFGAYPGGTPVIVHSADYSLVTASSPARAGEVIVIYATGLGPVSPQVPVGTAAPLLPSSVTVFTPKVLIGGVDARVVFSGLAPGMAGVYQLNVWVPKVPPGQTTVAIQEPNTGFGLPATIPVQ
jgi:uncharacterized protein (TIGR03437 family)